jgi:DMSO/TMAO reductase YedYZ molybdopterin-dependent catalytic subunit
MKFFKTKEDEIIKTTLDEELIISPDTKRIDRIPPGQKQIDKWPVLHSGKVPKINLSNWKFKITGLVREEKEYTLQEFRKLSQVKVLSDIHCVTSWSKLDNIWQGISTSILKEGIEILPAAKYVMIHAEGNFTANLSLEDFFRKDVLFATHHNGKQLSRKHGYPLRLVVPHLYFWKSAKWVNGVEFIKEDIPGFWESNGYHIHGDHWKEERYSWQNR